MCCTCIVHFISGRRCQSVAMAASSWIYFWTLMYSEYEINIWCSSISLSSMKWLMYAILLLHLSASWEWFVSAEFLFEKRIGQVTMDPFMWNLHTKLRIISSSVPGLPTNFPCRVGGHRWTTFLHVWWFAFRFSLSFSSRLTPYKFYLMVFRI